MDATTCGWILATSAWLHDVGSSCSVSDDDLAGRVTQEARTWKSGASTGTLTNGYTNNNQLTSVTHTNAAFANESFAWDSNGNATGTGYRIRSRRTGSERTASPGATYSRRVSPPGFWDCHDWGD